MRASYDMRLRVSTMRAGELSVDNNLNLATVARPLPSTNCLANSRDFSAVKTSLEIKLIAMGTFSLVRYRIEFSVRWTISARAMSTEIASLSLS